MSKFLSNLSYFIVFDRLAPDPKYNIPPKHFKYPAGRYIKISENSYCLELGRYTDEELSHHTNELYPLIIRVVNIWILKRKM